MPELRKPQKGPLSVVRPESLSVATARGIGSFAGDVKGLALLQMKGRGANRIYTFMEHHEILVSSPP
jgi:hypothetical protein